jgi:hypothetical protein
MISETGKIIATAPAAAPPAGAPATPAPGPGGVTPAPATPTAPDTSLPDPSPQARTWAIRLLLAAGVLAVVLNKTEATTVLSDPAKTNTADFALFASFYIAAQVIERALELVSPLLPPWPAPAEVTDPAARVAHLKADRSVLLLGMGAVLGVGASCGFGLYFLEATGIHTTHTVDAMATGITLAAGAKPLHDFVGLLQKQTTPSTGSAPGPAAEG